MLWRVGNGYFENNDPKVVVVLIGTNNIKEQRNTAQETAAGVVAVTQSLVRRLPNTRILLLGILPCGETADSCERRDAAEVNRRVAETIRYSRVTYLDIGDKLVEADRTISKEIMPDALHLTEQGYEILAAAIEPTLADQLGEAPQPSARQSAAAQ